jgi:hypothetical protein
MRQLGVEIRGGDAHGIRVNSVSLPPHTLTPYLESGSLLPRRRSHPHPTRRSAGTRPCAQGEGLWGLGGRAGHTSTS